MNPEKFSTYFEPSISAARDVKTQNNNLKREQEVKSIEVNGGIWKPSILDKYADKVAVLASTKQIIPEGKKGLKILGNQNRFDSDLEFEGEKFRAGRTLLKMTRELDKHAIAKNIVKSRLTHSGNVFFVDEGFMKELQEFGPGKIQIPNTDGLVTNMHQVPLYVSAADCSPVSIYDPENNAIGLFHNGFLGIKNEILPNGIKLFKQKFSSLPENFIAVIGPSISQNYERPVTDMEAVQKQFPEIDFSDCIMMNLSNDSDKRLFYVAKALEKILVFYGVKPENIQRSRLTTDDDNNLFSSERKEGGKDRDSFGSMIMLKK